MMASTVLMATTVYERGIASAVAQKRCPKVTCNLLYDKDLLSFLLNHYAQKPTNLCLSTICRMNKLFKSLEG